MTLQQQLEYFWERGFYSVVKDTEATSLCYFIISTKDENGRFRESEYSQTVEDAKLSIGANPGEKLGYLDYMDNWKIVDTIHPSELMGKGFQVGDKVEYKGVKMVVEGSMYIGSQPYYFCEGQKTRFSPLELKPVLPVEESKTDLEKLLGCNVIVDGRITGGAVVMVDAKGKAIAMFKEGKIVNL